MNPTGPTQTGPIPVVATIGAAKSVGALIDNGDGTFTTSYTIAIANEGNESLSSVQISDDLAAGYPAGYTVSNLTSADLTIDPAFDGGVNTNLLDGNDSLAVGASGSVSFDVTFIPTSGDPIDNQALATGTGDVTATSASMLTSVGTDPTDPSNPTGPTPTPAIPLAPSVAAAKAFGGMLDNGDGTFTTTYSVAIANDGNETLNSVQITDDLASNYPAGYSVTNLASSTFTVNPGFDGGADKNLLAGVDTLAVGSQGTVSFEVVFVPAGSTAIDNQAEASGVGVASGATATALSTVGTDPLDPANPTGPTPTGSIGVVPSGAASKSVDALTDNGDGTFTTTYTVWIANDGNEALSSVQIRDDLATNYPAGFTVSNITSPTLTPNALFDGDTVTSLLVGTDTLPVAGSASVSFDVTFLPTSTDPIDNLATFTGAGLASGAAISEDTTVGTIPTATSNPTGPTSTGSIPVVPGSAAAKAVAPLVDNGDGTFTASYTVTIANNGNELLNGVQITDDLASNFAPGYTVSNLASATLATNPGFDGDGDQNLLSGVDTLAIGTQAVVTFDVTFTPVSIASIPNRASVSGTGDVSGDGTSALSTVGVDPTDPANLVGPTLTTAMPITSSGAAAKAVDALVDNGDGTFTTSYTIVVANNGNERLNNIQISDDLATAYPAGYTVSNLTSGTLSVNSGFNGGLDTAILDGSDTLAVGASGSVSFDVTFVPASTSPINNQATLTGTGDVSGSGVSVTTSVGSNPLDPANPVGPTPTPAIPVVPAVAAAKAVDPVVNNGDGTFTVSYTIALANNGNEVLDSVQISDDLASNFPAGYVVNNIVSTLTVNGAFDGSANQNLLAGTDSLAVGESASVSFDVTFVPTSSAPINNQAVASGTGRASSAGDGTDDGRHGSDGSGEPVRSNRDWSRSLRRPGRTCRQGHRRSGRQWRRHVHHVIQHCDCERRRRSPRCSPDSAMTWQATTPLATW
ncbi:MAG: hypothetical protein R2706_09720 [Acidimicrobiales bacterium]